MSIDARPALAGIAVHGLPDQIMLPSQYFVARRSPTAEYQLMVAVLQEAIRCVEKYRDARDYRSRRLYHEVTQWFLANEPSWPYSFSCICDVIGLEADAVRQSLNVVPVASPPRPAPPRRIGQAKAPRARTRAGRAFAPRKSAPATVEEPNETARESRPAVHAIRRAAAATRA